jgi:hypothetical protein
MKRQPERTCIGCRSVFKKNEVIRIVAGPASLVIDYREKLPGRAAYVCPTKSCIQKAFRKEVIGKALRLKIRIPAAEEFQNMLAAGVEEKIKSLIAISAKADKLAAGYSAVHDGLLKGRVEMLLYARDFSEGTKEKVAGPDAASLRQATIFTRDELGRLLGRELVGVIGILDKGLADALWKETKRLKGLINIGE